ncbi:hypothetical protein FD754_009418 [Muntiacus muntjak]|uniref:Arb2 domain-containing protein n=1 Tax=Muntiacus muntjak TaxID=9888 RepID=A0A5N3WTV3_MUNMU|nr:hypothetical protein FD754_009418 [Muntiacus muntjak]
MSVSLSSLILLPIWISMAQIQQGGPDEKEKTTALKDLLSRIDLDELMKKDEPPLDFPDTLEGFEYAFNEKGQLRHIKTGEPFVFNYREDLHRWNQKRYEALGEQFPGSYKIILYKYSYQLLLKEPLKESFVLQVYVLLKLRHQGLFQWISYSHQVAKVLEVQLQHSPSSKYSGLISFRMDWEDPLRKGMATHSNILAWRNPWTEEPGGLQSMVLQSWTQLIFCLNWVFALPLIFTRLSDFTFTFQFHALEKETATHSSVLAWRIPGMAEPGGLPSMGSHRVRHD